MKSSLKILLIAATTLAIAGLIVGIYLYNLKPRDLKKVTPDFVLTSFDLLEYFENQEDAATAKYVNRIIEVSGEIRSVQPGENNSTNILLKTRNELSSVICTFPNGIESERYKEGSQISVRGECSGYLMDVLLNNCVVVNANP